MWELILDDLCFKLKDVPPQPKYPTESVDLTKLYQTKSKTRKISRTASETMVFH